MEAASPPTSRHSPSPPSSGPFDSDHNTPQSSPHQEQPPEAIYEQVDNALNKMEQSVRPFKSLPFDTAYNRLAGEANKARTLAVLRLSKTHFSSQDVSTPVTIAERLFILVGSLQVDLIPEPQLKVAQLARLFTDLSFLKELQDKKSTPSSTKNRVHLTISDLLANTNATEVGLRHECRCAKASLKMFESKKQTWGPLFESLLRLVITTDLSAGFDKIKELRKNINRDASWITHAQYIFLFGSQAANDPRLFKEVHQHIKERAKEPSVALQACNTLAEVIHNSSIKDIRMTALTGERGLIKLAGIGIDPRRPDWTKLDRYWQVRYRAVQHLQGLLHHADAEVRKAAGNALPALFAQESPHSRVRKLFFRPEFRQTAPNTFEGIRREYEQTAPQELLQLREQLAQAEADLRAKTEELAGFRAAFQQDIDAKSRKLELKQKAIRDKEAELAKKKDEVAQLEKKFAEATGQIDQSEDQYQQILRKLVQEKAALGLAEANLEAARLVVDQLTQQVAQLQINLSEREQEIQEAQHLLDEAKDQLASKERDYEETIREFEKKQAAQADDVEAQEQSLDQREKDLAAREAALKKEQEGLKAEQEKLDREQKTSSQLQAQVEKLERELEEARGASEQVRLLKAKLENKKQAVQGATQQLNDTKDALQETKKRIEQLESELHSQRAKCEEERAQRETANRSPQAGSPRVTWDWDDLQCVKQVKFTRTCGGDHGVICLSNGGYATHSNPPGLVIWDKNWNPVKRVGWWGHAPVTDQQTYLIGWGEDYFASVSYSKNAHLWSNDGNRIRDVSPTQKGPFTTFAVSETTEIGFVKIFKEGGFKADVEFYLKDINGIRPLPRLSFRLSGELATIKDTEDYGVAVWQPTQPGASSSDQSSAASPKTSVPTETATSPVDSFPGNIDATDWSTLKLVKTVQLGTEIIGAIPLSNGNFVTVDQAGNLKVWDSNWKHLRTMPPDYRNQMRPVSFICNLQDSTFVVGTEGWGIHRFDANLNRLPQPTTTRSDYLLIVSITQEHQLIIPKVHLGSPTGCHIIERFGSITYQSSGGCFTPLPNKTWLQAVRGKSEVTIWEGSPIAKTAEGQPDSFPASSSSSVPFEPGVAGSTAPFDPSLDWSRTKVVQEIAAHGGGSGIRRIDFGIVRLPSGKIVTAGPSEIKIWDSDWKCIKQLEQRGYARAGRPLLGFKDDSFAICSPLGATFYFSNGTKMRTIESARIPASAKSPTNVSIIPLAADHCLIYAVMHSTVSDLNSPASCCRSVTISEYKNGEMRGFSPIVELSNNKWAYIAEGVVTILEVPRQTSAQTS